MLKKINESIICLLLSISILIFGFVPVFADESLPLETEPSTEAEAYDVSVCASYYKTGTDNEYKVIFTALSDIPEFVSMSCKISLTGAEEEDPTILADYTKKTIIDATTDVTFNLERNSAGITKMGQLFSFVLKKAASVPSETVISVSDASIKTSADKEFKLNIMLSFKEGDILPELSDSETKIYDSVVEVLKQFPDAAKISYYQKDESGKTSLAPLYEYAEKVKSVKDKYNSAEKKENIDKFLEFNGYDVSNLDKIIDILNKMYKNRGIIELSFVISSLTESDILDNQFVFVVYDNQRQEANLTGLTDTVAREEILDTLNEYNEKKAVLDKVLNSESIDYEALVYSCDKQISNVQKLSQTVYYKDCLESVKKSIDDVYSRVNENYTGNSETKKYLLSCLDDYKSKISLIENGIDDVPTMAIGIVTYQQSYNVVFTRKSALSDNFKSSVIVVVTDNSGKKIDEKTYTFDSDKKTVDVGMYAEKDKYPEGEKITITGYYVLEDAKILVDTQTVTCAPLSSAYRPGGIGGGKPPSSGNSPGNTNNPGGTGGTLFPSNQGKDENDNNDNTPPKELFGDIGDYNWAKEAIEGLYYAGIINGMEDDVFNPKGLVTREQFSKMVVQLFGISISDAETNFIDVDKNAWYAPYVNAALKAGYIQGQSNEYFGIGEPIMRQDMATILYRAMGSRGKKSELAFSDESAIASYAKDAVSELVGLGVINGYEDGTFLPRGTATRAEAAKMIWGIYQIIK